MRLPGTNSPQCVRIYVTDKETLKNEVEQFLSAKYIAVDTETTGLSFLDDQIRLIQISAPINGQARTIVIDVFQFTAHELVVILSPLFSGSATKLFYNAKFDVKFLRACGLEVASPIVDVMIHYKVLRNGIVSHYGLKDACEDILSIPIDKKEQKSDWSVDELTNDQLNYAAQDVEVLFKLYIRLEKQVRCEALTHIVELEQATLLATIDMEYNGIPVDVDVLTKLGAEVKPQVAEAKAEALRIFTQFDSANANINLNSTKQVLAALNKMGLPVQNCQRATFEDNIVNHPIYAPLIEYGKNTKLMQFVTKLPTFVRNGRIHCSFNQMGTDSGRYSCSTPNMQQIPRESIIRSFVRAEEGNLLVVADYSQMELVIAAQITQDATLLDAFNTGLDVHRITASFLLDVPYEDISKEQRRLAKAVNFGLIYGMGAPKFQKYARVSYKVNITLEEAYEYRAKFFNRYPAFIEWHRRSSREIDAGVNAAYTLAGRRRLFSHVYNDPHLMRFAAYINHQDQGTGGDVTKLALTYAREKFRGHEAKIVMTVHDEIMVECKASIAPWVRDELTIDMVKAGETYVMDCPVAVECGVGKNWLEAH